MVRITDDPGGGGTPAKVHLNGMSGRARVGVTLGTCKGPDEDEGPEQPLSDEDDCSSDEDPGEADDNDYDDDDDDIYQEFEEFDFDSLPDLPPDRQSIASDDSFYPLDDSLENQGNTYLFSQPIHESPESVSFFKACSNNNTIIVKIMIRQGLTQEEVKETDKNGRVGFLALQHNSCTSLTKSTHSLELNRYTTLELNTALEVCWVVYWVQLEKKCCP